MTDQRKLELNTQRIRKHWKAYCKDMGMNISDWTEGIYLSPECMMEGTSVNRLTGEYTNKTSGKKLYFGLGLYYGRYEVHNLT